MQTLGLLYELASLFNIAVGSPKTGATIEIPKRVKELEYLEFVENQKTSYVSHSILGKMFQRLKLFSDWISGNSIQCVQKIQMKSMLSILVLLIHTVISVPGILLCQMIQTKCHKENKFFRMKWL